MYYIDSGTYPLCDTSNTTSYLPDGSSAGGWCGWHRSTDFILGLVPKYVSKIPNTDYGDDSFHDTYIYKSDGTNYKLLRNANGSGLPAAETNNNSLLDPFRKPGSIYCPAQTYCAWGYWSDGAKDW